MTKIKKIFIADLGLNATNKYILYSLNKKIRIIDTNVLIPDSNEIHSKNWINAVSQKTQILNTLVKNNNVPIVMLDSDMIIIEDFSDVIDSIYDIQICERSNPLIRPDGLVVNHIASFVAINTISGSSFIDAWIARMKERIVFNVFPPHETPAMVETLLQKTTLNIGCIADKIVSCENNYIKNTTKIVHAKGRTKKDKITIFRFTNIKNLPYKKIITLFNGKEKISFTVAFTLKKIINIYEIKNILRKIKHLIIKQISI
jgi:hypothetical protein